MTESNYNHKEAFALMWYSCECGHRERAYNSRDGVTPFGTTCPSCGGTMNHDDWHLDEASPDWQPKNGQLIFRDGTSIDAHDILRRRKARMIADSSAEEAHRFAPHFDQMFEDIETGKSMEFPAGWPIAYRHITP